MKGAEEHVSVLSLFTTDKSCISADLSLLFVTGCGANLSLPV